MAIIAREGAHAASSRALAAEMGVSTGALWHWFADMDEVLDETFHHVVVLTDERITRATAGLDGLDALFAMLGEIFPLTDETVIEAYASVSFWGRVPSKPLLASYQAEVEGAWRKAMQDCLDRAKAEGVLISSAPVVAITDVLLVLTKGHQLEHVLQTEVAAPQRQWAVVGAILDGWITPGAEAHLPWKRA